jgi:hypothetical protein
MSVQFRALAANTGSSTLNVNGLGARNLKKSVNTDLTAGDILEGQIVSVIYDGTNFQILAGQSSGAASDPFTFTITTGRPSIEVVNFAGGSDTTAIRVRLISGNPGPVLLSLTGLPAGISAEYNPGGGFVNFVSSLRLFRSGPAVPGSYTITVTGSGGGSLVNQAFTLQVATPKRVFVTSTTYAGNLGFSSYDAACQTRANAASLGGTWTAWISSSTVSAASRVTQHNGPYVLLNGTTVASNWNDLTDGTLTNPINRTEFSLTVAGTVWSNTTISGGIRSASSSCNSWTSSSGAIEGATGSVGQTDGSWTNSGTWWCNQGPFRLYCFEN